MATTFTAVTGVADRLRISIARTARRMRQEGSDELTATQSAALTTLDRFGPLTPSELAARERMGRPTATRLVARMEQRGLITRTPDPEDGRSSMLAISGAGQALIQELRRRNTAFLARRLQTLDPEERALLERAAQLLDRMLDEDAA